MRILPIPPAPALLHEFLIEIHPIRQDHVSKDALVLVVAVRLDRDLFLEDEVRGNLLRLLAEGLAFLWAIDAAQANPFNLSIVKHVNRIAIDDPHQ